MTDLKWLFKEYMIRLHIEDFKALAKMCGIKYHTLLKHLEYPELFRLYEFQAINEVLHFKPEDLLKIFQNEN